MRRCWWRSRELVARRRAGAASRPMEDAEDPVFAGGSSDEEQMEDVEDVEARREKDVGLQFCSEWSASLPSRPSSPCPSQ